MLALATPSISLVSLSFCGPHRGDDMTHAHSELKESPVSRS